MNNENAIVIVGASSHIAQLVTRIWASESTATIFLVARDLKKLNPVAAHLQILNPDSEIICKELSFSNIPAASSLIDEIFTSHSVSKVLLSFGTLPDQSMCQKNFYLAQDTLMINGILPIILCEIFISKMQDLSSGSIAVIGSVAGDRGRKSNYFYGAAKSMIDTYIQGARHRLSGTSLNISIVKPGPTATPMTEGLGLNLSFADPNIVAHDIVNGIKKKQAVIYTPTKWRFIMMVIRNLPAFIFNKLNI